MSRVGDTLFDEPGDWEDPDEEDDDAEPEVLNCPPLSPPCADISLSAARSWLSSRLIIGDKCPCCEQFAKIYKRKLNRAMAKSLIWLVREYVLSPGWVQSPVSVMANGTPKEISVAGGSFAKLWYWQLIVEKENEDTKKRTSGLWKPTERGLSFVRGEIQVPAYVYLYDGKFRNVSDNLTDISGALREPFDYSKLMSNE